MVRKLEQQVMRGTKAKADNPLQISDQEFEEIVGGRPNGNLSDLSQVVFYSKYSRYRDDVGRREFYSETAQRATEYNVNLAIAFAEERGILSKKFIRQHEEELKELFAHQFGKKLSLSGRTLWIGGTEPSYVNPMANFNCSFMVLNEWRKLGELIHLGMVGSGIGFRILKEDVAQLKPLRVTSWAIDHEEYEPISKENRRENSLMTLTDSGDTAIITIGDSKEGWRQSIDLLFEALTDTNVEVVRFNYDNVRPAGEKLQRFGGRAGGPSTIKAMFNTFHKILNGSLTNDYPSIGKDGKVEPLHMLDLANAIGKNIVSGDVRSIAEIGLLDPEDKATIEAKRDIFTNKNLNHRYVSNNSVFYMGKPGYEQLMLQFEQIKFNGEPCFVNGELGLKKRPRFKGVNPCVEILLDDRGLCNLTTVNWMAFVENGKLLIDHALKAFRLATRAGLRMTLPRLEIEEWDVIQQRDRLLGVSFTGWMDMVDAVGLDDDEQKHILRKVREEIHVAGRHYAETLGINAPLLSTCVKPEGTISQLFGGVSSGLHVSHDSNFIRRVRSATKDPITKAIFEHDGWTMDAEFFDGSQHDQIKEFMQYAPDVHLDTIVVDGMEMDAITPDTWQYKSGILVAEFFIAKKHGGNAEKIKNTIELFYDKYSTNVMVEEENNSYHVRVEVLTNDYDLVFGKSQKVATSFPNVSPAKRTKANFSAIEQLEMYRKVLNNYTDHNPSNTISVREHEWQEVIDWVYNNWDDMLAVSFLSLTDTPYPLSPFETVHEDVITNMMEEMEPFDVKRLWAHDLGVDMEIVEDGCATGACPVR